MYLNIKNLCVFNNFIFKNLVHLITQAYEKESFFTFSLVKICIHELSLNFITDCKELMRFIKINDLLVCFFFPLFQVFLFQTLSPSSVSLPVTSPSCLSVFLSACLSVFVCLSACLSVFVCLSISLFLSISLSSYFSHFRYIFFFVLFVCVYFGL